jgi:hypothetical protein
MIREFIEQEGRDPLEGCALVKLALENVRGRAKFSRVK